MKTAIKSDSLYPWLGVSKEMDMIVLFHDFAKGVVIHSNCKYKVGYYCEDWNVNHFVPYIGELVISND